ncbi:MAG: CHAD domain-containing protein [Gemmatimonadota bacterium]
MSGRLRSFADGADRLEAAAVVAEVGDDPEGVHALRVTCRRIRVGLKLSGLRVLEDDVRWLSDHFGPLRDLDVLLAGSGVPPEMRAWATDRRAAIRLEALASLEDPRYRGLVRALRSLSELEPRRAGEGLGSYERRVAKAARRFDAEDLSRVALESEVPPLRIYVQLPALRLAHALRRRLRDLRYAREWAGRGTRALVRAQDGFGVLSDETLLVRCALGWEADEGVVPERFRVELHRRLMAGLETARNMAAALPLPDPHE